MAELVPGESEPPDPPEPPAALALFALLALFVLLALALDLFLDPGPLESTGFRLASSFLRLSISSRSTAISSCLLLSSY